MKKRLLPLLGLMLSLLLAVSCGKDSAPSPDRDAISAALEQAGYTVSVSDFIIIGETSYDVGHLYAVKDGDFVEILWGGDEKLSSSVAAGFFEDRFPEYDVLAQTTGAYLCGTDAAVGVSGVQVTYSLVANADLAQIFSAVKSPPFSAGFFHAFPMDFPFLFYGAVLK